MPNLQLACENKYLMVGIEVIEKVMSLRARTVRGYVTKGIFPKHRLMVGTRRLWLMSDVQLFLNHLYEDWDEERTRLAVQWIQAIPPKSSVALSQLTAGMKILEPS